MKTLILILFPLFTYCQTITNSKGDTVLILNKSNDTTVISVKTGEVFITIAKDVANNDMLFVETKDKSYVNWFTMRTFYYFKPLE